MNRADFLEIADQYLILTRDCPEANHVCVRDGKFIYIAKGAVFQAENSTTTRWPDFLVTTENFQTIYDWVTCQPPQGEITIRLTVRDVHITCCDNAIAVPHANKETNIYADIEETILRPLLVNKYQFTMNHGQWNHQVGCLISINRGKENPNIPTVEITVTDEGVILATESPRNVRVKGAIKIETGMAHHKEWKNRFMLLPFAISPSKKENLTFSFTLNESKQLSPLMLQYENGITLVAIPMWN